MSSEFQNVKLYFNRDDHMVSGECPNCKFTNHHHLGDEKDIMFCNNIVP